MRVKIVFDRELFTQTIKKTRQKSLCEDFSTIMTIVIRGRVMKNHLTRNISILLIGAVIVTTSTIGAVLFFGCRQNTIECLHKVPKL